MMSRKTRASCLIGVIIVSVLSGMCALPAEAAGGSFGGGTGTSTDPYVIEDAEDLQNMTNELDAYYVLGGDIDASDTASWDSGAGFVPVGTEPAPFTGSLDGRGHVISGLHINRSGATSGGLFGYMGLGASVRDVGLEGADVTGAYYVGALVGFNHGEVTGCAVSGVVSGYSMVGGLVGWNHDEGSVTGSTAAGSVSSNGVNVGGLVGYDRGEVSGCRADVAVAGSDNYVGGLAGTVAYGDVSDCHATGDVSGMTHVGGLVGSTTHGEVSGSSASGSVSGFMGVGGLAGTVFFSTVSLNYAMGDVSGTGDDVGGLVGANGAADPADESVVSDCYATGDVTTTGRMIGGLVGINRATVSDSYSTGRVPRTSGFGGLIGVNYGGLVEDCFWDNTTSGVDNSEGGTGLPTAEMKMSSTFADAGWDLAEVWFIVEGVTYPCLRWQDAGAPVADAGPDRTADLGPDGSVEVTLDGSASTDDFGYLEHEWSFEHGGSPVVLRGATAEFTFESPGVFEVTLTVTDATGHEDADSTTVTVRDVTAPVADAGPDRTVDEDTPVTFDGSGSSDNEGVVNYTWALTVEDVETTFYGVAPTFTFGMPGVYPVKLWVADAAGNEDEDEMTVTVKDVTPPTADAGPDQRVPVGSNVSLAGAASADNVGVATYTWAFFYDGQARSLVGAEVAFTFDAASAYNVTLTIADAAGNTDEDTVVVTVVGTGTVSGTVLDKGGKPVGNATVEVTASDGLIHPATTAADGSFSLDVPHGEFTWKVSKKGYKTLSGSSSVDAMGTSELEFSDEPLVKEDKESPGPGAVVILLSMALAALVAATRRRA